MSCTCKRLADASQKTLASGTDTPILGANSRRRGLVLSLQSPGTIVVAFGQPTTNNPRFTFLHTAEQGPAVLSSSEYGDLLQKEIWVAVGAPDTLGIVELFVPNDWSEDNAVRLESQSTD